MEGPLDHTLRVELDGTGSEPAGAVSRGGRPAIPFEGWLGLALAVEQALISVEAPPPVTDGDRDG